jgi:glycosyltransferase involved in cell wall biosynthesis
MACGCLVLSGGGEGSLEIIEDGLSGRLCAFDDPAGVAAVVAALLDEPEVFRQMITTARTTVEERYSLEKSVEQIELVLQAAFSERKPL